MQVLYSGHVQGVGFRYTVKSVATGFDVTGHGPQSARRRGGIDRGRDAGTNWKPFGRRFASRGWIILFGTKMYPGRKPGVSFAGLKL